MELRHLRYFLTLAEELHFRKAAERLFIAQPALSRQIKELEDDLGVSLFKRNRRNVALTLAGKFLQEEGYKLMRQVNTIRSSISDLGKSLSGIVNIGCIGSSMSIIVPDLIERISAEMPEVRINLSEDTTQNLLNALADGKLDLVFCRPVEPNPKVASEVIYEESTCLVVSKSNKWLLNNNSKVTDLKEVPLILFPREAGTYFRDRIINVCSQHGFFPKITHESIHANTLFRFVEKDIGVSIVPQSLAKGYDLKIDFLTIKEMQIPLQLTVCYKPQELDDLLHRIINLTREISTSL